MGSLASRCSAGLPVETVVGEIREGGGAPPPGAHRQLRASVYGEADPSAVMATASTGVSPGGYFSTIQWSSCCSTTRS